MLSIREELIDGIMYRITEDEETGLLIQESLEEYPTPEPQPTEEQIRITSLEQQLAQTNQDLAAVLEMIIGA